MTPNDLELTGLTVGELMTLDDETIARAIRLLLGQLEVRAEAERRS